MDIPHINKLFRLLLSHSFLFSSTMSLFTAVEIEESEKHRQLLARTPQTTYSRCQRKVIVAPAPLWSLEETTALTLLIYAGVTFTKAWNQYLQHSLLWRTKATSSGEYANQGCVCDKF